MILRASPQVFLYHDGDVLNLNFLETPPMGPRSDEIPVLERFRQGPETASAFMDLSWLKTLGRPLENRRRVWQHYPSGRPGRIARQPVER